MWPIPNAAETTVEKIQPAGDPTLQPNKQVDLMRTIIFGYKNCDQPQFHMQQITVRTLRDSLGKMMSHMTLIHIFLEHVAQDHSEKPKPSAFTYA